MKKGESIKTDVEVEELFKFIYQHIKYLPSHKIQNAVIPVSVTNESMSVFEQLANPELSVDIPQFYPLAEDISLVNPTNALLCYQKEHNFVSMHYIFKTVKRAKFLFVFNHSQIDVRLAKVKETLKILFALVRKITNNGAEVAKSCGIIINNASRNAGQYLTSLLKMVQEENFLQDKELTVFAKNLLSNKNKLLMMNKEKGRNQQFLSFVSKMKYFQMEEPSLIKIEARLQSMYLSYAKNDISKRWEILMKFLISKLDQLAHEAINPELKIQVNNIEDQFNSKLEEFNLDYQQDEEQSSEDNKLKSSSTKLLSFIISYINLKKKVITLKNWSQKEQKWLVSQFFKIMFDSYFLTRSKIKYFFMSYFEIRRFLSNNTDDTKQTIFQLIDFKQMICNLEENIRKIVVNLLLDRLQDEIKQANLDYDFGRINVCLGNMIDLIKKADPIITFSTPRILKKLIKFRAEFKYKEATLLTQQLQKDHETIQAWLQFLEYSQESTLIQPKTIEQALSYIANALSEQQKFQLALKTYGFMSEHKCYRKKRTIYQRGLKFYPQILKYTLMQNWHQKQQQFVQYCNFLLRMGKNEEVRELCLEGLGVMRIQEDPENMQRFKQLLLNARAQNCMDMHNTALEKQILFDTQIKVNQAFIDEVRYQMNRN